MHGQEDRAALTWAELVDLEVQLDADRALSREDLRARDSEIGLRIARPPGPGAARGESPGTGAGDPQGLARHALLRRWLAALRGQTDAPLGGASPPGSPLAETAGSRVAHLYTLIGRALAGVGLLLGVSTAAAVLAYDGSHPVNVVHFLAVFVGLQVALVGLSFYAMRAAGLGVVHHCLRLAVGYLCRRGLGSPGLAAGIGRWQALGQLYGEVERWLLFSLTQGLGVGFNLGALVACAYLIATTDLAFAWSTTLDPTPAGVARFLQGLSAPWSFLPQAVPSAELIAKSRYFRQAARFDPALLKEWWAFLLAALTTYGLLPRCLLWGWARLAAARARARLPLDHGECEALVERLIPVAADSGWHIEGREAPLTEAEPERWASAPPGQPAHDLADLDADADADADMDADIAALAPFAASPAADRATGTAAAGAGHAPAAPLALGPGAALLVRWADAAVAAPEAQRLVQARFRLAGHEGLRGAGGKDDGDGQGLLQECERLPAGQVVMVLVEAWEAPGKAILHFLRALRLRAGARRPIIVLLLNGPVGQRRLPDPEDESVWSRRLATLGDPYLRVEPLGNP
jgi:hypothetical protein